MDDILRVCFLLLLLVAVMCLFTPNEAVVETVVAIAYVAAVIAGFAIQPNKDVYYLKTRVFRYRVRGPVIPEHDYAAVRLELTRLWLLFLPTLGAVAFLVVSSARGKLAAASFLNRAMDSVFAHSVLFPLVSILSYASIGTGLILSFWLSERFALRRVEACSAHDWRKNRWTIGYQFRDEKGEYCGGDCVFFGLVREPELAGIVFYDPRKPERGRIAMGLLFHRPVIIARGIADLDRETEAAHAATIAPPKPAFDIPS